MAATNSTHTQTHSGVDRALDVIALLVARNVPLSISDISKEIGMTRATTYSIVNSLLARHYLEQTPSGKKYTIGYNFYHVGSQYRYQYPFLSIAEHHMDSLFKKWGIRLNVALLKPDATVLIILTVDSSRISRLSNGNSFKANASASGKVLLAYQPERVRQDLYSTVTFPQYTPHTITKPEDLEQEFERIRKQGYAFSAEELVPYRASIAVPIFDKTGSIIAAITFAGDLRTLTANQERLTEDLISAGNSISGELGYMTYNPVLFNDPFSTKIVEKIDAASPTSFP